MGLQCHKDWCKLDLAIRLVNHSPTAIREVSRIISTLLVSTFIDDLVKHVYRAGYKEVMKGANRTAMEKTVLSTKITALNHWKDSHAPFSSDSQVAGLHMSGLITSIDEELSEEVALSWFDLASTLVGFIFNFPTQHAFRVPKGHLQRICHAIKPMVSVHYSYNNEIDVDYVKSTLITAAEQSLEDKRLWIMPWSTGKNKVVSHTLWIAVQPGTRKRARADSNNSDDLAPARRVVKEGLAFSQSLQRKDHTRAWRVKAKGKPALADLLPYLDSKSIPSNIKLTERAGGILFQQGLAEGFHMDLAHHRVGFWAAIVLAQLLPFCRVQIPEGKDRTFRSKTEAQAYMLGPHVKFVHAGDKGVTARIPWIEAFLLAWVFWLNVRDEKCEVGSRAGSDEKKFRKKLGTSARLHRLLKHLTLLLQRRKPSCRAYLLSCAWLRSRDPLSTAPGSIPPERPTAGKSEATTHWSSTRRILSRHGMLARTKLWLSSSGPRDFRFTEKPWDRLPIRRPGRPESPFPPAFVLFALKFYLYPMLSYFAISVFSLDVYRRDQMRVAG